MPPSSKGKSQKVKVDIQKAPGLYRVGVKWSDGSYDVKWFPGKFAAEEYARQTADGAKVVRKDWEEQQKE